MFKVLLGLLTALWAFDAALATDTPPEPRPARRHVVVHHPHAYILPPERHVVEGVYAPGSGVFLINGRYFTANTEACMRWLPGEEIRLVAGDWRGYCVTAVFYNVPRRAACAMSCDGFASFWYRVTNPAAR